MGKPRPKLLGVHQGREYFYDPVSDSLFWRVPDIRESICAPPGYVLVSADYSQIEVKLMAFLSQDSFLISAINSGKDIHSFMASEIVDVDYDLIVQAKGDPDHPQHFELDALRTGTKCVTFGLPYGAGPLTIAVQIAAATGRKLDDALVLEAGQLIDSYFRKASKLKKYLDNQKRIGVELRHTRSLRGRIRWYRIPDPSDPDYRETCAQVGRYSGNQPIQASNADMLKMALSRFYLAVRGGVWENPPKHDTRVVLVIHDEIASICQEAGQEEVQQHLKEAMDWAYGQMTMHVESKSGFIQTVRMADILPLQITVDSQPKDVGVHPVAGSYLSKD